MNLNDVDLEARLFYRLIKVLHIILTIFCMIISCVLSFDGYMFNSLEMIAMTLVIGFSLSYFIPTLIKKTLLYIAYGKKIVVFSERVIAATSLVSEHVIRVLKIYPTIIYFAGICFFYALAFLFNTDAFFTLAGLWILGYPLIKFILLCKEAFADKNGDAKDKLWDIFGCIISFVLIAGCEAVYLAWKDPQYHYIFELLLKCTGYISTLVGACYFIWLVKKYFINKDRDALNELMWILISGVVWGIVFFLYGIVKSKNLNFHLWHFKPLVSHFSW